MHGRGSDQGGRWPVGIWFALVGISAGTVASFAMVGWTFTRGLYTGADGTEPMEIESGTVIIEGEESPATPGEIAGLAGAEPSPGGLAEPGEGVEPVAAEPQAELVPQRDRGEPDDAPGPPVEEGGEESEPPRLVPIGEDPCGPEESSDNGEEDDAEDDGEDDGNGWDHGDWDNGGWDDWDHGEWDDGGWDDWGESWDDAWSESGGNDEASDPAAAPGVEADADADVEVDLDTEPGSESRPELEAELDAELEVDLDLQAPEPIPTEDEG